MSAAPRRGRGDPDDLLTPKEAAEVLSVSVETVRRYVRSGRLRGRYIANSPRLLRIRRADLWKLLDDEEAEE